MGIETRHYLAENHVSIAGAKRLHSAKGATNGHFFADGTSQTWYIKTDIHIRESGGTEQLLYGNVVSNQILTDSVVRTLTSTWTPPANIVIPSGGYLVITEKLIEGATVKTSQKFISEQFVDGTTITPSQWQFHKVTSGAYDGGYNESNAYFNYGVSHGSRVDNITFEVASTDTESPSAPSLTVQSRANLAANIVVSVGNLVDNVGVTKVGTCFTASATPPIVSEDAPWVMNNSPGAGFDVTQTANGTWYCHAYSKDAAGNVSVATSTIAVEKVATLSMTQVEVYNVIEGSKANFISGLIMDIVTGEVVIDGDAAIFMSGTPGLFIGTIFMPDGTTPAVGAKVLAVSHETDTLYKATTGADGKFSIEVPVGYYHGFCRYVDGSGNKYAEVQSKPWVLIQSA